MVRWRSGTVRSVRGGWRGACELDVETPDGPLRALAYPHLVGTPEPGDRVLLNVGALVMGLGTGGYALVVALPDRLPADPPADGATRDSGHLVKARYTPLQAILLGVDEEASPHRDVMAAATSLDGMPVVTADLHSALPAILAGIHADRPEATVAYVMTDGGALPAWFSRTLDDLRGHLAGTVTTGQSFGGDLEASTVHTGLLAARHVLGADVAIVAQGPGNLGTGTTWGFSGVALGEAINAIAVLGGRPIGSLRISDADGRDRHRGISHHSLTAYGKVALARADLVVPRGLDPRLAAEVEGALAPLGARHSLVSVASEGLDAALRASPVGLSTMGRKLDQDHSYFLAAAAAGRHAATLLP
ncbi:hypothetical protein AMIS_53540 [Actinoplanes missouriensis 431]|uniref:DUF3866 domain-containing protein n=1 Tax=Actinoplanes missouriensis (strain ATCC 14538 / DSM 43046 / CBS 188.64 / JCM 3121 / NBRC 102363 / NCIMB 12654 / NRRL B-3342 / UNCC 431) TaxID=512565 RepID=I0HC37_ACTM4|nr:DUF3866 family protein [Actinoplanes missouriensis]BAL90574.1 hypothetical protein AMIS_53540 [Actinoplanes missouriensis 431]